MTQSQKAEKERIQAMYGVNEKISGTYNEKHAVRCTNGIFVGRESGQTLAFKGIPYACPPVGERRWKRPAEAKDGTGVYEAYYFGHAPIQTEWISEVGSYYPQSEDCLTLNIWVNKSLCGEPLSGSDTGPDPGGPAVQPPSRAVMVFFHGGSYGWGATSDPIYDGHNLVSRFEDIILVTVEYRVGIMGFIDFSSVAGGEEFTESGNLGLLDQICALKWIQKNIRSFGGDPDKVTIFGESAGGGSVSLIPLIDEAKGLFARAIAESGSVALTYSREECQQLTGLLLKETGCTCMTELMALPEDTLKKVNEKLNDSNNFPERDGVVLPVDLYGAWREGKAGGIDFMTGTNADESRYWIREMGYELPVVSGLTVYRHGMAIMFENNEKRFSADEKKRVMDFFRMLDGQKIWKLTEFYNEMLFRLPAMEQARLHAQNGNRTYTYYFTCPGADPTIGACHAMELAYVFRNLQETIYTGGHVSAELADTMQEMWANFARYGDPSTGTYHWDPYDVSSRKTMILGERPAMTEDLKRGQRILLEKLLPHYLNGCYSQLSFNVPHVRKAAALAGGIILAAVFSIGHFFFVR